MRNYRGKYAGIGLCIRLVFGLLFHSIAYGLIFGLLIGGTLDLIVKK